MRCLTPLLVALLATIGCGTTNNDVPKADDTDAVPTDTDTVTDTDTSGDDDDDDTSSLITTFTGGMYRIGTLNLVAQSDTDGDGINDNQMPAVLDLVDQALPAVSLGIPDFNTILNDGLATSNIILLDYWVTNNEDVQVGVLYATEDMGVVAIDPASQDEFGNALMTLTGTFTAQKIYSAGPGTITIPIQLMPEVPVSDVDIIDTRLEGSIDYNTNHGSLRGVLPVEAIIEDVVEPLVPIEGYDINGDGVVETKQELMDTIWALAPLLGDVSLPGGGTGVSCVFSYVAQPITI